MIGQYLSNTNESVIVSILQNNLAEFVSHSKVFFSNNKSTNITLCHGLLAKRTRRALLLYLQGKLDSMAHN